MGSAVKPPTTQCDVELVKLPADSLIPLEKLTCYLLVRLARADKSAFLARAGYTLANARAVDA